MKKQFILGIAASCMLAVSSVTAGAAGFAKVNTYSPDMFGDVPQSEWYASSVSSSYELGFMKGTADGVFSPNDTMTVAEAITVAARVHDAYHAKGTAFAGGTNWYDAYVSYAKANGIVEKGAFGAADYDRPVKRYEMALLFASAVPASYLEARNDVKEIPDVPNTNAYFDKLSLLYNAGVVLGNDAFGTFKPNNNIIRAEAAAIIGRVALPENRLTKTLVDANYGDAYYLINHTSNYSLNGSGSSQYGTPWNLDNRTRTGMISNLADNVNDFSPEDAVELWRDIDDVKDGLLGMDYFGSTGGEEGIYIKVTDDDRKDVWKLHIRNGNWFFNDADTGVKAEKGEMYLNVRADLDQNFAKVVMNGKMVGEFACGDYTASRVAFGSSKEGTGSIVITRLDVYQNYVVNDIFLTDKKSPLALWEVTGEAEVNDLDSQGFFDYGSAKLEAGSSAKQTFPMPISGSVVFETYMLARKDEDAGSIALKNGDTTVAMLKVTPDAIVKADGEKLRHHTPNIWQCLRIEADTVSGTVLYKVNGKKVGEFPLDASTDTVDTIVVTCDSGTVYFDDVEVYLTHEYDDYVPTPKPITDDGYDVILNICSLWREGNHFGWGAVSAHEDIEPILGYYDEGLVEVADWEIKMWVENGIDVAHFCWYSPASDIHAPIKKSNFNDALHDGFFNAKYSDLMKFTFMWENTGVNCKNLTQFKKYIWSYWMDYYFLDERFYAPDGYLTFTVWSYDKFRQAFGDYDKAVEAVEFMNEDAKAHGFNGVRIWFADGHATDASSFANMAKAGGSASYAYHWNQDGIYANKTIPRLQRNQDHGKIHIVPTVSVGFNNIGWSGVRKDLATLEDHRKVLEYIKNTYLTKQEGWKANSLIVSTWNEYGEGTYVMPVEKLHGYGYLENIAEVISGVTDHSNNIFPTEQQKSRLGHLYPDSSTSIFRYDYEKADASRAEGEYIKITVDKTEYKGAFYPVERGGEVYVAAEPYYGFFSLHNFYYEWSRKTGVLRMVLPNDREVIFTVGSNTALVDGNPTDLSEAFTLRDGLPVLPLLFLYDLGEMTYTYKDSAITVSTVDAKYQEIINNRVPYQYEFEVPGDSEGFIPGNATMSVNHGFLVSTSIERTGKTPLYDPMFDLKNISVSTYECNKILVGMKHTLENGKDSTTMTIYFATKADPGLDEEKTGYAKLEGNSSGDQVIEYEIDFSENPKWLGEVTQIRLDPITCGGTVEIDYVRFVFDEELAKKNAELIQKKEEAAKERLEKGIVVVNGDAEDAADASAFFGMKGNAVVTRVEDDEDEHGFVWKASPDGNGQIWTYMRQNVIYTPGTTYDVSYDAKLLGYPGKEDYVETKLHCNAVYLDKDGKVDHVVSGVNVNSNDGWMSYTFRFTVPETAVDRNSDQFCFYTNPVDGKGVEFLIDHVVVQKTGAAE